MNTTQYTLQSEISFNGIGLHTGIATRLMLKPALPNTGIVFIRKDLAGEPAIPANLASLVSPNISRRSIIGKSPVCVQTVEHLMAALHIVGIDNARIDIWGDEVPGMDGSAKEFVEKILAAGKKSLNTPRVYWTIPEAFTVTDNDAYIRIEPSDGLRISYELVYENPSIGSARVDASIGEKNQDFYLARTFCLQQEANALLSAGLGKGSNYQNTLVVGPEGIIHNTQRIDREFAKHKLLDLAGDLYLAGHIKARITAYKSGHALTMKLLAHLRDQKGKAMNKSVLNIEQIMRILPHRFPFLLVDRIIELQKGARAVGIKNVTMNEHFFQGHFPGKPVMPGVLQIEAMAQVAGIAILACQEHAGKVALFMSVDGVKFRKTVEPGDQLRIEAEIIKIKSKTAQAIGKAYVDDKLVCEAQLVFAMVN